MNLLLVLFGLGLAALGGYGVVHPQRIVNIGAKAHFEDSTLSERGELVQRGKGAIVVLLGMITIFTGLIV
ncbi:hypothetical protein ACFO0N_11185 [Halobium salinum]|uniref:Preprotein translocase subunit SecG n=1 Tax=Halobium salinum TaxID=1364940 RepID=A0ABD5PCS5_9EURY|nr:hypothetical protein [Halobium salinum]